MPYKMKKGATAMYGPKAMMEKGPMATSAERYDAKKAYDKNLTASARMHYLENDIADKKGPKAIDPDVKAAKKEIRRGANVLGGGNIIDDFGYKHGYQSDKTSELDNSRLVQRKKRKYVKEEAKSNIKKYRGKENREGFNDPYFEGKGNEIRKQEIKNIKKESKDARRSSRLSAKAKKKDGAMAYKKGPMAMMSSFDKVHKHKKGPSAMMEKGPKAMMEKKGAMAMKFDSKTDKGIKGLGSSNKSEGKYI